MIEQAMILTLETTGAHADAAARRARWASLTPTKRAHAVLRRQGRVRARRDRRGPVLRTVGILAFGTAAAGAVSLVDPSWVSVTGFLALGITALAVVALLIGIEVGREQDERLPDVIPPVDDVSLEYLADEQRWIPSPRSLHVRVDGDNTGIPDAVLSTQVGQR